MSGPLFNYTEVESLLNPKRGEERVRREELSIEELIGIGSPRSTENLNEWPKVTRLIRRGSLFVIEAKISTGTALLKFDPDSLERGYYLILQGRSASPEEGRTIKISALSEPHPHPRFAMLNPYKYRFVVRTISTGRPLREMGWRIGFDEFTQFDEDID